MRFRCFAAIFAVLVLVAGTGQAQQDIWIQIEAHSNLTDAEARANVLAGQVSPLEGYRLGSGWYALAIGPLSPGQAPRELGRLLVTRQIPQDSYLVDGGEFRRKFWPPAGSDQAAAQIATVETAPVAEPVVPDETPAQARRSEARLNGTERKELQSALAWEGHYAGAIDGAIGRGSRNAMAEWQTANGHEASGILTTAQRAELTSDYYEVLASIGMAMVNEPKAGIDIELPMALVKFNRYDAPFVHYAPIDDTGAQVILISQTGARGRMNALYDILQTLTIVPLDGPRRLRRSSFRIHGENPRIITDIYATISGDDIKGFALIWPNDGDRCRDLVLSRIEQSFSPYSGSVLPDNFGAIDGGNFDALAGFAVCRPEYVRSGFFVSLTGDVLTSMEAGQSCDRITLADETTLAIAGADSATGVALLRPETPLRPISVARFAADKINIGGQVALAGYSFGGRLNAPSLTFGTVSDHQGLAGEPDLQRLLLAANQGDYGGPILDASGAVVGMLKPNQDATRVLPENVQFAVGADRLSAILQGLGVAPVLSQDQAGIAPEDLAMRAADFTVLIQCWNS